MNSNLNYLIRLTLVLLVSASSICRGDCPEYYSKCKDALGVANGIITDQDLIIEQQGEHVKNITDQLVTLSAAVKVQEDELNDAAGRTKLWAAGAFVVGFILYPLLIRR